LVTVSCKPTGWKITDQFPAGAMKGYFFFFSTASRPALGTYPASYPMDAGGTFPGSKAAEA